MIVYSLEIGIHDTNFIGEVDSVADVTDNSTNSEEAIRRGEYAVIRSLIRVLEVINDKISTCFSNFGIFTYSFC